MKQTGKDIRFATGDAYVGGAYDGQPNKVEPSSGLKTSGYVPGTKLPFPRLNWTLAALGELLEGLLDVCALNWSETIRTTDNTDAAGALYDASPRQQYVTSFSRSVTLVSVPDYLFSLGFSSGSNVTVLFTNDGLIWFKGASSGISGTAFGPVAGLQTGTDLAVIVWGTANPGTVKKTLDGGATWAAAGNLDAGGSFDNTSSKGCYLQTVDRWIVFGRGTIKTSDALANATWTTRTPPAGWTGAPPSSPTCIAVGSDGALIGLSASGTGQIVYTNDGLTYSIAATGAASPGIISAAFSESHQLWMALASDGTFWTSPVGAAAWTQASSPPVASPKAIECFGRCVIASGDILAVSRDAGATWKVVGSYPPGGAPGTQFWEVLCPFAGSMLAAHFNTGTVDIEYISSLVAPYELGNFTG